MGIASSPVKHEVLQIIYLKKHNNINITIHWVSCKEAHLDYKIWHFQWGCLKVFHLSENTGLNDKPTKFPP